jgi:hypothetical protein
MPLILAHSAETGKWMFLAGGVLSLIFVFWLLAIAAQRNVLWVLAVLLIPVSALILIFVDSKALRPGLLYIAALALAFWGFAGIDGRSHLSVKDQAELLAREIAGTTVPPNAPKPLESTPDKEK